MRQPVFFSLIFRNILFIEKEILQLKSANQPSGKLPATLQQLFRESGKDVSPLQQTFRKLIHKQKTLQPATFL